MQIALTLFCVLFFASCNYQTTNPQAQERTNRVFLIELDNTQLPTKQEAVDTLIKRYERIYNNKYCYVDRETNEMHIVTDWKDIQPGVSYNDILLLKVVSKVNPLSMVYDVRRKLALKFKLEGSGFLHIDAMITKFHTQKTPEVTKLTGGRFYPEDPDRLIHFYISLYMKLGVRDLPV
jgi:hypothetical protein